MVSHLDQIPEELRSADKKDEIALYLSRAHGDIEDAKATFMYLGDELGFEIETDDVETVTGEPPNETFL
jgi:hypothetical protein